MKRQEPKLKAILYISESGEVEDRLRRMLQASTQKTDWIICRTVGSLSQIIMQNSTEITIAVLAALNAKDLLELVSIGDLLSDLRIILIAPDGDKETVAGAHTLRPRFLTYVDRTFDEIAAVVKKMLGNDDSNKTYERW
jgi:hypothetical protein